MHISDQECDGTILLTPVGQLDLSTYPVLRDRLLKHAAERPNALIVDLDQLNTATDHSDLAPARSSGTKAVPASTSAATLSTSAAASLSVFTTVWRQLSSWPDIPLYLVCSHLPLLSQLASSGVSRFVPTHPSVAAALAALSEPPPRRRAEFSVPVTATSASHARRWLTEILVSWGLAPTAHFSAADTDNLLDDAVLVGSELVENLIRHAGSAGVLRLELHPAGLSVAVSDNHPRPPRLIAATSVGGRGLALIDILAVVWGYHPRFGGGKVVWAVLGLPDGPHHRDTGSSKPAMRS